MDEAARVRASIRSAEPADARAMGEVAVAAWLAAYEGLMPPALLALQSVGERETRFREILERGDGARANWVVERDGRVVGYASTGPTRDEDAAPTTAELYALYLHPDAWGCGLAEPLQTHALDALRASDFAEVTLWVLTANARARRFYERSGFTVDPGAEETVKSCRGFDLSHTRYRMRLR